MGSIIETSKDVDVLFILTPGDVEERRAVIASGADFVELEGPLRPGDYAKKINLGIRETTGDYVFLGADDLRFHPGWLEAALRVAESASVVGTNDLGNARVMRGEHATHSLVSRAYIERYGTIDEPGKALHEAYPHEFVDDELVATAKFRGEWGFAPDSIVEHLHPNWSKAPMDPLYAQQRTRMNRGRRVFQRRQHLWT